MKAGAFFRLRSYYIIFLCKEKGLNMRFVCPSCQTEYEIPDDKAQNYAKVRCSGCGFIWKFTPPETDQNDAPADENASFDPYADLDEEIPSFAPLEQKREDAPIPDSFFESPVHVQDGGDAVRRNIRKAVNLIFLSIALVAAAFVIKIANKKPPVPVGFENVTYKFAEEDYKRFLIVEGTFVSKTPEAVKIPTVYARFFNKGNVVLTEQKIAVDLPVLTPHGTQKFALKIERPPSSAVKAELVLKEIAVQKNDAVPAVIPAKPVPTGTTESRPKSAPAG